MWLYGPTSSPLANTPQEHSHPHKSQTPPKPTAQPTNSNPNAHQAPPTRAPNTFPSPQPLPPKYTPLPPPPPSPPHNPNLNPLPQTLPHTPPHPLLKLPPILPPQPRGLDVRRTLVVRTRQHADNAQEDGLGRLHGRPALRRRLVPVLVVFGRVQDRDADFAGLVDCASVVSGGGGVGESGGRGREEERAGRWGDGYCWGGRWDSRTSSSGARVGSPA